MKQNAETIKHTEKKIENIRMEVNTDKTKMMIVKEKEKNDRNNEEVKCQYQKRKQSMNNQEVYVLIED